MRPKIVVRSWSRAPWYVSLFWDCDLGLAVAFLVLPVCSWCCCTKWCIPFSNWNQLLLAKWQNHSTYVQCTNSMKVLFGFEMGSLGPEFLVSVSAIRLCLEVQILGTFTSLHWALFQLRGVGPPWTLEASSPTHPLCSFPFLIILPFSLPWRFWSILGLKKKTKRI